MIEDRAQEIIDRAAALGMNELDVDEIARKARIPDSVDDIPGVRGLDTGMMTKPDRHAFMDEIVFRLVGEMKPQRTSKGIRNRYDINSRLVCVNKRMFEWTGLGDNIGFWRHVSDRELDSIVNEVASQTEFTLTKKSKDGEHMSSSKLSGMTMDENDLDKVKNRLYQQAPNMDYDESSVYIKKHPHRIKDLDELDGQQFADCVVRLSGKRKVSIKVWESSRAEFYPKVRPVCIKDYIMQPDDFDIEKLSGDKIIDGWLKTSFTDPKDRLTFLQSMGSIIYGNPQDRKFFVLAGAAGSGKSTAYDIISAILPANGIHTAEESMLKEKYLVKRVDGKDLLVIPELKSEKHKDSDWRDTISKIKLITGDSKSDGRDLYEGLSECDLTDCQILAIANEPPSFSAYPSEIEAIERRLVLIPFTDTISKAKKNPNIKRDLTRGSRMSKLSALALAAYATCWSENKLEDYSVSESASEEVKKMLQGNWVDVAKYFVIPAGKKDFVSNNQIRHILRENPEICLEDDDDCSETIDWFKKRARANHPFRVDFGRKWIKQHGGSEKQERGLRGVALSDEGKDLIGEEEF